jgi:excisionase family DNA binding protein
MTMTAAQYLENDRMPRRDAARYLNLKEQTLAAWATSGRYGLRFTKIGRLCFYSKADLDAFMESRSGTSTAEIRELVNA